MLSRPVLVFCFCTLDLLSKGSGSLMKFSYLFQSFLMNATQLFNCDGATKSPPGSGPPQGRPASPNLSGGDKSNPATHVFIQGWMLMAVAVSIFVPRSSKLLWFLRNHFARNKDSKYVFIQKNGGKFEIGEN